MPRFSIDDFVYNIQKIGLLFKTVNQIKLKQFKTIGGKRNVTG
ncbi:hypothetical protein M595_0191 [Lyngbya aestuarii BL J]|uniref:Uncharacterized protein n=1 Tax=Lyngbya aestuarii BL J TaxID=1348334 RepID=U7QRP0_9CYAN|nr:hypothetical protein M595_0191 [Lyngbya aestuarii BL J]